MTVRRRRRGPRVPVEQEPTPIRDALEQIRADWGLPDHRAFQVLVEGWEELVGAGIAAHAAPRSLRNRILIVEVDAAPWATELRYLEAQLRKRAELLIGGPGFDEIRVVVRR